MKHVVASKSGCFSMSSMLTSCKTRYTYLYPVYTLDAKKACTSFTFLYQCTKDDRYDDLGKGTSKIYRYVAPVVSSGEEKISSVAQWRCGSSKTLTNIKARGYDGTTGDINRDRGDYIYVVWKTTKVTAWSTWCKIFCTCPVSMCSDVPVILSRV